MTSFAVYCFSDIIMADKSSLEFEELSPRLHFIFLMFWKNDSVNIENTTYFVPMFFTKSIILIFITNMKILFKSKTF